MNACTLRFNINKVPFSTVGCKMHDKFCLIWLKQYYFKFDKCFLNKIYTLAQLTMNEGVLEEYT